MLAKLKKPENAGAAAAVVATGCAIGYALYKKLSIPGRVVETERHGGELVAEVLKAHGVEFVFTLVGGHVSPVLVAAQEKGMRVIDVRHEVTSVFAADAVARLTGVPGVAVVTAGPGVTNTITAVKNAQMAESPLVLLGGAAATILKGRGSLQDIDQMSVLKPIVKWSATVTSVRDIVPTLRRAFQEASSGTPAPVFVELPINVLYSLSEIRANMGLSKRIRTRDVTDADKPNILLPEDAKGDIDAYLAGRRKDAPVFLKGGNKLPWMVKSYLEYKLRDMFSGAFDHTPDVTPLPVYIPMPTSSHIRRASALLAAAKKPVMIVASQATLFRKSSDGSDPVQKVVDAVNVLGVPTFLSGMARGLLGRNSKLHVRQNRRAALKEADLVILAGAVPDFRLDYGRSFSKASKIVAVNRNPAALKQNTDLFWSPTLAVNADPASFLVDLAAEVGATHAPRFAGWAEGLKSGEAAKEAGNLKKSKDKAMGRVGELINPLALVHAIEDVLPTKSVLVGDGGDFVATASYVVRPRGPLRWLDPGVFGTLGVGGGFALGAKLARPDHEVWLLWGDGSVGFSVAEFDTMKRHGVSIIAVVGNDACWTQIEREQVPIFGFDTACPLEYTEYDKVSIGFGGSGMSLASPTDDIAAALKECQAKTATNAPVLLNVHIGSTNFREGSISV